MVIGIFMIPRREEGVRKAEVGILTLWLSGGERLCQLMEFNEDSRINSI